MIPLAAWRTGRKSWATILLLLAWGALPSSRAEASCGDYVMIGGRHAAPSGAPYGDPGSGGNERRGAGSGQKSPAIPRCHGPACSNNSIPPAAPASKIEVTVERWAVSCSAALGVLPHQDALPADRAVRPCDGFDAGILRPPR